MCWKGYFGNLEHLVKNRSSPFDPKMRFPVRQEYFLENGRYGHSPIRSDTSIWVCTKANTKYRLRYDTDPIIVRFLIFPQSGDVYSIYLMFLCSYSCDLVLFPFVLDGVSYIKLDIQRTYQFWACYSYGWLYVVAFPWHGTVIAHVLCHVTFTGGREQKWTTFLKSLVPNYLRTLSLSGCFDKD